MDEWLACRGEWKKSTLFHRLTARKSCSVRGARCWLTKGQIFEKYKDMAIVEAIISAKLADEDTKQRFTKPHPDAPECEACYVRMFICLLNARHLSK